MRRQFSIFLLKNTYAIAAFCAIAAILLYQCTRLFLYDEDIFVTYPHSFFLSDFSRAAIVNTSFLIDQFLYKTSATGYHVTSILLHLSNAVLATYIFRKLLFILAPASTHKGTCYAFLFIFLLSPIHSEPLCYLLGRAGLLVTFFGLLSMLFFLKAGFKNAGYFLLSLLCFVTALFCYEISWTFPFIITGLAFTISPILRPGKRAFITFLLPYFLVFFFWLIFKAIFLNKMEVTPYGNSIFYSLNLIKLLKNGIVLFFRNLVPPFRQTSFFIGLSGLAGLLILLVFGKIKKSAGQIWRLYGFLFCSWIFALLPAVLFGINSHNSESERYVYFSSVFAIMFMALSLASIKSLWLQRAATILIIGLYSTALCMRVNDYVEGGRLAKQYLFALKSACVLRIKKVYLIGQPSQFEGALLFRAYGDKARERKENITTLNDYMHEMPMNCAADFFTLSMREVVRGDKVARTEVVSMDNLSALFPGFTFKPKADLLVQHTKVVTGMHGDSVLLVGFKSPVVYIFK